MASVSWLLSTSRNTPRPASGSYPSILMLVNAAIHVLTSARLRTYNPGLYPSVLLFLPWGLFLTVYFSAAVQAGLPYHAAGLLFALAEHAAIALYATHSGATGGERSDHTPNRRRVSSTESRYPPPKKYTCTSKG
ncbi:HXXEE domain-containing protein [Rubrobacter xylanophilus]